MRKGFLMVLAVVLVAAMAAPAMADLSTSGFVRIKGHTEQNYTTGTSGGLFILPSKDTATASYVEQRQRFILDWKSENVGARGFFEIDFGQWGDSAYTVGRNQGAGFEGDSINLETKNFYLWFNVPNTSVKVTAGLQNATDSFGGMIFGYADMAGIFLTGKMEPVSYKLGWAKFAEGATKVDDDIDLYVAEAKFAPSKDAKVGLNLYVLRDAGGNVSLSATNTATTFGPLSTGLRLVEDYTGVKGVIRYDPSVFYFLGVDGSFKAGPAMLSGYAFYNFGTIKNADIGVETATSSTGASTFMYANVVDDVKVKAWAVDLRADLDAGPGKAFIEGAYVSGSGPNDSDIKSPIVGNNYALAGSFPLTSMDMQILLPNLDDINASAALAYDVQNKTRGIIALAAGYRMKFNDMLSGKVGVGYLADAKNPLSDLGVKKHKATEVNANVNYTLVKGLDLGLYGAYAFLTDWEDYQTVTLTNPPFVQTGGTKRTVAVGEDADNIYKAMFRVNYAF